MFSGMKKEDGPSAAMEDVHVPTALKPNFGISTWGYYHFGERNESGDN